MIKKYKIKNNDDVYNYVKDAISRSSFIKIISTTPLIGDEKNKALILEILKDEIYLYLMFSTSYINITAFTKYDATKSIKDQEGLATIERKVGGYVQFYLRSDINWDLICIETSKTFVIASYDPASYGRDTYTIFWGLPTRYITNGETTNDFYFGKDTNKFTACMRSNVDKDLSWLYGENTKHNMITTLDSILPAQNGAVVPTYGVETIPPSSKYGRGKFSNALNCSSAIMPLIFYVCRAPRSLKTYSAMCYDEVINFIDMYNISTGKIIRQDFPYEAGNYICFNPVRRKRYMGIAVKLSEKDMKNIINGELEYNTLEE